eukprot:409157_1
MIGSLRHIIVGMVVLSIIGTVVYMVLLFTFAETHLDLISSDSYDWSSTDHLQISQSKYTLNIDALFYETDVSSIFINGMIEHYWVHKWNAIQSVNPTRFVFNKQFEDDIMPMIVKKYSGQFGATLGPIASEYYNKFIWGDILLLVHVTTASYNKTIALVIAGDDEYCRRRWDRLGSDLLIKSPTKNRSYYDYPSADYVYDRRLNALPFNCSSVPVIASQFYNPSLPKHIVHLPLFIHRKQGNYTHLHNMISKPYSARTLIFNAIINPTSGWRQSIDFWQDLNQLVLIFFDQTFLVETKGMDNILYQQTVSNSRYTLCPSGNNPETYRLWESLLLGSIPIVAMDMEYFIHSCLNSYAHFVHHQFSIEYHRYVMTLNQTQCETMMICWSKYNAMYLLQQDLNHFIPLIVLTEWDITLFEHKLNEMNSMGDAYWDRFQKKAMQWREYYTQRTLRKILNNVLYYVDALYTAENVTLRKTYPAAHNASRVTNMSRSIFTYPVGEYTPQIYHQRLKTFLKENLKITIVIYSCYNKPRKRDDAVLLNKAIISIFKYIDLTLISRYVIMELCGYPKVINALQDRYGSLFDIDQYNDVLQPQEYNNNTIQRAMAYSVGKLQNPWILHLINYPQFKSTKFIEEALQFYHTIVTTNSSSPNRVLHCSQGVGRDGNEVKAIFAPSFAYNKHLESRMMTEEYLFPSRFCKY